MAIIKVLTLFLAAIIFFLGYYLYTHQHKPFLMFHPENNHILAGIVKIYGLILILLALITLVAALFLATWALAVALIFDVIVIATLPVMMLIFLQ
ncbi:hypothetical protein [Liquorilactobacillus capillatus]|uniref:Integral membrane protein n=1 Tax=Liquorilactobacillus capillatus DSM 19910 TaxID=1423731 RepID=A0A0R1LWG2_9LACO|nr:hypothetical protein [Liquorilactobacillus capillatus]KRL00102.1 hypothetical protein FC81_GL000479 [Liquorilactobacillus capillatus DSM 19910]